MLTKRRGLLNAAFTLKELRELTKIESVECRINQQQFTDIHIEQILNKLAKPRRRITEFMYNLAQKTSTTSTNAVDTKKIVDFVFLSTPLEIIGNANEHVSGVKLKENRYRTNFLSGDLKLDNEQALNQLEIEEITDKPAEVMNAGLVVRSIGYKNVNIDADIPFDKQTGTVSNERGKVVGKEGLYCTGWIKRGPRGVIVDTTTDAYETAQKMCADLKELGESGSNVKPGLDKVTSILKQRGIRFVDKEGWSKIDQEEVKRGKLVGKPREKFHTIDEMLCVAFKN